MIRACVPLVAVAAVALAACSTARVVQVTPITGPITGQCHSDKVRGAVGLAATPQTVERARVDSDSNAVGVVRGTLIRSGGTASGNADPAQGHSETGGDRLTIEKGPTNNITAIYCG